MKHTKPRLDLSLSLSSLFNPKHEDEDCPFMHLTEDLILNILLRLSAKSLGMCALSCTTFNYLISEPKFAMSHMEFSNNNKLPLTLVLQTNNVISKLELEDCMDINKGVRLDKIQHQLPEIMSDEYECLMIGSCNGLVCMYLVSTWLFGENVMFVWNPVTTECEAIALPGECGGVNLNRDACWFGYIPSIDEYKIFLSYSVDKKWDLSFRLCRYAFKTKKWRKFRVSGEVKSCFASGSDVVFVNDALHCVGESSSICKFDLVKETFEKVPVSAGDPGFLKMRPEVEIGVVGKGGCLCVVFVRFHSEVMDIDSEEEEEEEEKDKEDAEDEDKVTIEAWVLKEYGNLNSWGKWCRIELKGEIFRNSMKFLGFAYNDLLCFRGKDGMVIIDPKKDPPSYAIARCDGSEKVSSMSNYLESLIAPIAL